MAVALDHVDKNALKVTVACSLGTAGRRHIRRRGNSGDTGLSVWKAMAGWVLSGFV